MRRKAVIGFVTALSVVGLLAAPASAKGGSGGGGGNGGGGGTTTTAPANAAIKTVSSSITCSSGTVLSVTLSKGINKRVEVRVVPTAGATNPDGTPAPDSWWNQSVFNETTGASIGGWGGNVNLNPGLVQTVVIGGVPAGTSQLTYTAVRRTLPSTTSLDIPQIMAQPIVETCTGTFTVVGK